MRGTDSSATSMAEKVSDVRFDEDLSVEGLLRGAPAPGVRAEA